MSRAGRRRKLVMREANGRQIRSSQAALERETQAVMVEARQRIYGLTEEQAKSPDAVTELGRLRLRGRLSQSLYAAGTYWLEVRAAAQAALKSPQMSSGGFMERSRGHDSSEGTDPAYVEQCCRALDRDADISHELRPAWTYALVQVVYPSAADWCVVSWRLVNLQSGLKVVRRYMQHRS